MVIVIFGWSSSFCPYSICLFGGDTLRDASLHLVCVCIVYDPSSQAPLGRLSLPPSHSLRHLPMARVMDAYVFTICRSGSGHTLLYQVFLGFRVCRVAFILTWFAYAVFILAEFA